MYLEITRCHPQNGRLVNHPGILHYPSVESGDPSAYYVCGQVRSADM